MTQAAPNLQLAVPPPVTGRHRDKALASARKRRAIELRMTGMTYQAIADEMGYANAGSVYAIIKTAQAAELGDAARQRRELEVARLDALQVSLWPRAMQGDVAAVEEVRKIIETRMRLLGLIDIRRQRDQREDWPCCQGPSTVIVRADDCRHEGCDKHGRF